MQSHPCSYSGMIFFFPVKSKMPERNLGVKTFDIQIDVLGYHFHDFVLLHA